MEKNQPPSKNNEELKNIFKNGVKDFQIVYRNINTKDSSNIVSYGCHDCGRKCIHCKYLKEKDEYDYSSVSKLRDKIRQNVNCQSRNVVYLVTCKKCKKQGVRETMGFK